MATGEAAGTISEQEPESLLHQFDGEDVHAGRITAGTGEAGDEAVAYQIVADVKHDGNGCSRRLGGQRRIVAAGGDNHGHLSPHQIADQRREPIVLPLGPAIFDRDIATLYETGFLQTASEAGDEMRERQRRGEKLRNPTVGIAGCCACASGGHAAAAPPSSEMNSRRFSRLKCIRCP